MVSFHGTTRNYAKDGREVLKLDYSCYPEMAMKQLATIATEIIEKHQIKRIAIHHSIGSVPPKEAGVLSKFKRRKRVLTTGMAHFWTSSKTSVE